MDPRIRVLEDQLFTDGKHWIYAAGPHNAAKPTANIVTGSMFIESDTGTMFVFDETSAGWTEM